MTKIDVIAGFYGAGKTRFIKKIMSEGIDKKTVLYVKCSASKGEFDAFSMKKFGINGFEIYVHVDTLFYSETIVSTIHNLIEIYEPTRIIIETDGNMSLSKIKEVLKKALIPGEIVLNAIVTIVNVFEGIKNIEEYPHIFREQIENAQSVFLSGTKEINKEELYAEEVALRKFNSHATIFVTPWDEMEGINMRNSMEVTTQLESIVRHITSKEKLPLVYERKKSEEHKVLEEQKLFKSLMIHTDKVFCEEDIKKIITTKIVLNKDIIRFKGSFKNKENGSIQVDYLQGKFFIVSEQHRATGNLQVIGKRLSLKIINQYIL